MLPSCVTEQQQLLRQAFPKRQSALCLNNTRLEQARNTLTCTTQGASARYDLYTLKSGL